MGETVARPGRGGAAFWWVMLGRVPGVGAVTMLRLVRTFGSAEAAGRAPVEELVGRGGLSPEQARELVALAAAQGALRARIDAWRAQGIDLIPMDDPRYPVVLADLRSPPPLLYLRGSLLPEDTRAAAVVGTRSPDRAGLAIARRLGRELAGRGFTIVSGLARGIDAAAHRGALQAPGGRTIAVLGCGLLRVYPPENALLAQRVAAHGCLAAEVPPDVEVQGPLLLARDRIQAGLSRAVIVIQAHAECGSIVTARHAVQCGRLLYGVPWAEPPFSEGWQALQALGAQPLPAAGADFDALAAKIEAGRRDPGQLTLP